MASALIDWILKSLRTSVLDNTYEVESTDERRDSVSSANRPSARAVGLRSMPDERRGAAGGAAVSLSSAVVARLAIPFASSDMVRFPAN
jgi:hypothetical protein